MKFRVEKSFDKDVDNISDKNILKKLRAFIAVIESAESMQGIPHLRKIEGYSSFYRIKIGGYRLVWKSHVKKPFSYDFFTGKTFTGIFPREDEINGLPSPLLAIGFNKLVYVKEEVILCPWQKKRLKQ